MSASTKNHETPDLADDAKDRMSADLESLKEAFAQLRKDVMRVLENAVGAGKSKVAGAANNAKSHLNDLQDAGCGKVAAIEQRIESNPLAATAIAFGIGMLVAKILNHRR